MSIIEQMTKADILDIIKACRKNKVSRLKVGDLELSLMEGEQVQVNPYAGYDLTAETNQGVHPSVEEEAEQLLITDPVSYEKILAAGDMDASPEK